MSPVRRLFRLQKPLTGEYGEPGTTPQPDDGVALCGGDPEMSSLHEVPRFLLPHPLNPACVSQVQRTEGLSNRSDELL